MDVQAALLAAIADRPGDDTPRLAYADWLDDHAGDLPNPDAARARAEFIRVQCEIKRYEHLSSAAQQGYADLYRRQDHLLTHHRRDLLGPLADALGTHDALFDRGFVSAVGMNAATFVRYAADLATLRPLPDVAVTLNCSDHAVLGSPYLGIVTTAHWQPLQSEDVYDAWTAPETGMTWPRLKTLILAACGVYDPAFTQLLETGKFPALTQLDVAWNGLTDEGLLALVSSPLWPRLRVLILAGNPITDEGAEILLAAAPTALENLNVAQTAITRHGQQRLLRRKGWKVDLF